MIVYFASAVRIVIGHAVFVLQIIGYDRVSSLGTRLLQSSIFHGQQQPATVVTRNITHAIDSVDRFAVC